MPKTLNAEWIRRRLSATHEPEDPLAVDFTHLGRRMPESMVEELAPRLRPAGVLLPLIERGRSLSVLLTERAADLRHHAGQVSFPGGGMEDHDADITATALREAHEEVGIHPDEVDIAGYLCPTATVTGFAVTPVVGFVRSSFELRLESREVECAFEVPLEFLMDVRNEARSLRQFEGAMLPVASFHYAGHRIWGATASMLVSLRKILIDIY